MVTLSCWQGHVEAVVEGLRRASLIIGGAESMALPPPIKDPICLTASGEADERERRSQPVKPRPSPVLRVIGPDDPESA